MSLAMVYTRDGAHRAGLEDAILRTPKDVAAVNDVGSNTRHAEEEFGSRKKRSELGVAEDSTSGKSRLYKATQLRSCDRSSSRSLS